MSNSAPKPLLVIDVETTGLDRVKSLIMEIACLALHPVTLEELSHVNYVIDPRTIEPITEDNIQPEAMELHTHNGLLDDVAHGNCVSIQAARESVTRWAQQMGLAIPGERYQTQMVGNNPDFDRAFVNRFYPELASVLHYRMIDVTTLRTMASRMTGLGQERLRAALWPVQQGPVHRSLTDCRNCAAELRAYDACMRYGWDQFRNYLPPELQASAFLVRP